MEADTAIGRPGVVPRARTATWNAGGGRISTAGIAIVIAAMAMGVLLISVAYAGGREAAGWADLVFWSGQLLLFLPAAWRVASRRPAPVTEMAALVGALAVATYMVRFSYSPLEFRFPDELMHLRTAEDILRSGDLFTKNPALPVSPLFPGLEIVVTAVATLTGLSIFTAGSIVVGLSHVLATVALLLLFREVGASPRTAGLATVIYATGPHYQSFDLMFIYQALALPLAFLAILATVRLLRRDVGGQERAGWWALALFSICALVPTHHVTGAATFAVIVVLAVNAFIIRRGAARVRPAVVGLVCAGVIAAWVGIVAPETLDYLARPATEFTDSVAQRLSGDPSHEGAPAVSAPLLDRGVTYAGVLVVALALPFGWRRIWRTRRGSAAATALAIASAAYYGILIVRITASDGAELAGRAMTFVLVPVAYVLAQAAADLTSRARPRWAAAPIIAATAALLFVGGVTSGWPPHWGRLPGPFVIGGFERGFSNEGVAAADWAAAWLPENSRIGGDTMTTVTMGTLGRQDGVRGTAPLFYGPAATPADRRLVRKTSTELLAVDQRMSELVPPTGSYFPVDPLADRRPLPLPARYLSKFDRVPGVDRLYDGGALVIYDLRGSWYAR